MSDGIESVQVTKRPYQKPHLLVHGTLTDLTRTTNCIYGDYDSGTGEGIYLSSSSGYGGYSGYCDPD
jgi:hypothetical protein